MILRKVLLLVSAAVLCVGCNACGEETAEETTTAETTVQVQTYVTTAYTPQEIRAEKTLKTLDSALISL